MQLRVASARGRSRNPTVADVDAETLMTINADICERKCKNIARGVGMMTQKNANRAENAEYRDVDDNPYIDFVGASLLSTPTH